MSESLRELLGPALGTLHLLLDEIRLLLDDGIFDQFEEDPEATVTAALVDGTGIPTTHLGGPA